LVEIFQWNDVRCVVLVTSVFDISCKTRSVHSNCVWRTCFVKSPLRRRHRPAGCPCVPPS
jgi:hypothetical protein